MSRISVRNAHLAHRRPEQHGFALLIALSMMAFVLLLLLSLTTFSRVEIKVAEASKTLTVAQQNALLSLNVALGQLQKYAGPDQRVTTTANIGGATNTVGVLAPTAGKSHWVGVWGNQNTPSDNNSKPALLNWLVSGNEETTNSSTNGAPPFGPASGLNYTSTDTIAGLTIDSDAHSTFGTSAAPLKLLVGKNSAGSNLDNYVAAPLMEIETSSHVSGRYAWWIGDEGVKARVNLWDPHAQKTGLETEQRGYSFISAQRSAVEWVDQQDGSSSLGSYYPAFSTQLSSVSTLSQLSNLSASPSVVSVAMKERYHDLTTTSYSVLSDVASGGLKKDLTRGLATGAPSSAEASRGVAYAPANNRDWIFAPNSGSTHSYGVPTWELLRSYANKQITPGASVPPTAPSRASVGNDFYYDDLGVSPVITYAGLGMDFTSPGAEPPSSGAGPSYPAPINMNLYPVAVLWNPYTVPISGTEYTLAIGTRTGSQLQLREGSTSGPVRTTLYMQRSSFSSSGANGYFRFKLTCPALAPGESIIFMLPANTTYQPGLTELTEGLNVSASATMDTGASLADAADADQDFVAYATNDAGTSAFGGGEMDAILAEFDPTGIEPSTQDPETASTNWYTVAQRVGSGASALNAPRPLYRDSTVSDMLFSMRMRSNFPDGGSGLKLQWIAHGNARSPLMVRTKLDSWKTSTGSTAGYSPSYAGRFGPSNQWPDFNTTIPRASTGKGLNVNSGTPTNSVLWEFTSPDFGLFSLGQLQHAPVSIIGTYPSYAIGNSLADYHVPRTEIFTTEDSHTGVSSQLATQRITTYYDLSWQLNRSLWDHYFFSTVPSGDAPAATSIPTWSQTDIDDDQPLPNSRLHYYRQDGKPPSIDQLTYTGSANSDPYNQAATNLLLAGGFNVNSTSEQAWRAVLASVNQLEFNPETQSTGSSLKAALSRFAVPTGDSSLDTTWEGYRELDEGQIAQLASNIVAEVRKRGPFLSLADFINRRLVADETGLKGTLQAAIDASTTGDAANLATTYPFSNNYDLVSNPPGTGESFDAEAMRNDVSDSIIAAHRSRSAFAPKFLTQADILSTIGPVITARSDTFVIRTYGESVNPIRNDVSGRAWCEAIVQRSPEYIDQNDPALTTDNLGNALLPAAANEVNRIFGRRFHVVSFRWLSPSEI